jgi:hypothetical protein
VKNPYAGKPEHQFWRRGVSGRGPEQVDPVVKVPFGISRTDQVATAGSCFAQHIARHLKDTGFSYFVPEDRPAHPFSEDENYGTFSARYGNVYTVRQLWQLFQRAYGLFTPSDTVWRRADGRFIDPFRPRIQAGGFASAGELLAERTAHLAAVRRVFEECDLFIFTLGLTEGWVAKSDGAVFPLAPGTVTSEGDFDAYAFHNFTVAEMEADLARFINGLRSVNPNCRVLLTVSPVALVATYEDSHVLPATIYSKSALRVVAETATHAFPMVGYFPSYEMITGPHTHGAFWEDDLREVRPEGVAYVMSIFARHYLASTNQPSSAAAPPHTPSRLLQEQAVVIRETQAVICDEEQIEQSLS